MALPFYTRYDPPPSVDVDTSGDEVLTKQEFKDECDVNNIMKKYIKTGVVPAQVPTSVVGDFSEVGDFMAAQEVLLRALAQFQSLPSKWRDRFQNDPVQFLAFVRDPANIEEARAMGMLKPKEVVPPVVPPVVP